LKEPAPLTVAADCGTRIGTGHVMRCLALAQAWKRGGGDAATFLIPEGSPAIEQKIVHEGSRIEVLSNNEFPQSAVTHLLTGDPGIVVLDGYGFSSREQLRLRDAEIRFLVVDDYGHAEDYPANWILNQNPHASPEMYPHRSREARLLLGPSYALLRREFLPWLSWKRSIAAIANKILITIGGSDPDNLSLRILESLPLLDRPDLEVTLAVGAGNPHLQQLRTAAQQSSCRVNLVVNAPDMPALMAWADVAISGAGGTSYELCFMGLPSLLFVVAENQRTVADQLSKLLCTIHAGWAKDFFPEHFARSLRQLLDSQEHRLTLSTHGRELVDGLGAERVRSSLLNRSLRLRPCRDADRELLFSWANDPAVRKASFHSALIPWEDHERWFTQKMRDPNAAIYLGENENAEPTGFVRFQVVDNCAILSVAVAPEFRGSGWGRNLITFSVQSLARSRSIQLVKAFVKPENQPSIRLFESSGFHPAGTTQVAGQPALLFTWRAGSVPSA
jgi:UDP-2,4-diacetamido-2,4,6-trideoxy-beta-L-altropyranose hydrolase